MKALETQLQLNLSSGETMEVKVQPGISVKAYFTSLSILNRSSHIYGCVYLATEAALDLLSTEET